MGTVLKSHSIRKVKNHCLEEHTSSLQKTNLIVF